MKTERVSKETQELE